MEVVLTKDVAGLGKKVICIREGRVWKELFASKGFGYLRNQRGPQTIRNAASGPERQGSTDSDGARQNAAKIDGSVLVFVRKAGQGRIFGSITPQDIAAKILSSYKVKVDKRKVLISENLKDIGRHQVTIVMHPEVRAQITVEIRPEVGT